MFLTDTYKAFGEKFGKVFYLMPAGIGYEPNESENTYCFPSHKTKSELLNLMQKSLDDNHDYIFDIVKNDILVYDDDVDY